MKDSLKSIVLSGLKMNFDQNYDVDFYPLASKRYLLFWHTEINKTTISKVLEDISQMCLSAKIVGWKTVIVLANTSDQFESKELLWFDGENTFVVFYLINSSNKKVYLNKQWIYPIGLGYRRFIKDIHAIISSVL